jgi:hypothetical protein
MRFPPSHAVITLKNACMQAFSDAPEGGAGTASIARAVGCALRSLRERSQESVREMDASRGETE